MSDEDRFEELSDTESAKGDEKSDVEDFLDAQDEMTQATMLKEAANAHFLASRFDKALSDYREALALLPRIPAQEDVDGLTQSTSEDTAECKQLRAALNANVAAVHVKKEQWKDAVEACTEALKDDPTYEKALHRRAVANEKINTWTSLSSALEDWKSVDLISQNQLIKTQVKAALNRLPTRIEERKQTETAEMLAKLKDLGNSVLGRFGLSTDNFKMTQNPNGTYGMSFQQ